MKKAELTFVHWIEHHTPDRAFSLEIGKEKIGKLESNGLKRDEKFKIEIDMNDAQALQLKNAIHHGYQPSLEISDIEL